MRKSTVSVCQKSGFATFLSFFAVACAHELPAGGRSARTLDGREVFFPTYMPPEKTNLNLFAPGGANSARLF
jgi:hypothetical protein